MVNTRRSIAGALAVILAAGLAGCGGQPTVAQSPPRMQPRTVPTPAPRNQGMSTRNKVLLVAGAAAIYYLYQKHKNKQGNGPQGRYFRSKNGRVYYRDMKTGAFQWVDPPTTPIEVPQAEFERYFKQQPPPSGTGVLHDAPPEWSNPNYR